MSDETLGLPIGAIISLASLEAGTSPNDILKWDGTDWISTPNNFVSNPLTLQAAIPAFNPALPAPAVNAGYLYKKDSLPDLFWYPDGGPEINLLTAGGGITVLGASTNHAIVRWDGVLGAAVLDSDVTLEADAAFSTAGSKFLQADTNNNVLLGKTALASVLGNNNVAIGHQAGDTVIFGSNNVLLGSDADTDNPLRTNVIVIGANTTSVTADNSTVLSVASVRTGATPYILYYDPSAGTGTGEITCDVVPTHPDPHLLSDGTAADPTYSFSSDSNTGIYRSAVDTLNITTAGSSKLQVDTNIIAQNGALFRAPDGSAATPAYSFTSAADTGLLYFNDGSEKLGVSINGVNTVRYTSDGLNIQPGGGVDINNSNAALAINDDTRGFLPPRMTTIQRNLIPTALVDNGLTIYNIDTADLQIWNGVTWTIAGSALTNLRLIHVSTNGNDVLAAATPYNMSTPFLTLEAASAAAVACDLIIVLPGTYAVTTIAANGIAKNDVNWYFHPCTHVSKATAGPMFSNVGFASRSHVYGKAAFSISGTATTYIAEFGNVVEHVFEAVSCTSVAPCVAPFILRNNSVVKMNVDTLTSSNNAFDQFNHGTFLVTDAKLQINAKDWICNSNLLREFVFMTNFDITVNANILQSAAGTLFPLLSSGTITLNANRLVTSDAGYVITMGNQFSVTAVINAGFCQGVSMAGTTSRVIVNGVSRNNLISGGYFECGAVERITCNGGNCKIKKVDLGANGATSPINVSSGYVSAEYLYTNHVFENCGIDFNVTGGVLDLYSIVPFVITLNRGQGSHRIVNGGTLNLYGNLVLPNEFSSNYTSHYGIQVMSGILNLYGSINNQINVAEPYAGPCIVWSGGNIQSNGGRLYKSAPNAKHIRATNAGLQLRVAAGGLTTNTNSGLLDGQAAVNRVTVLADNLATQIRITVQGFGAETFNVPILFGTAAAIATELTTLINASGTLNATASQVTPGVDTYLTLTNDADGLTQTLDNLINVSTSIRIQPSHPITEILGGLIIQSANVL